jgi:signal transduction histidine kinase
MERKKNNQRKLVLVTVYAFVAVAFITGFQLYWLYSVYTSREKLIKEEAKNKLQEYVLDNDWLYITKGSSKAFVMSDSINDTPDVTDKLKERLGKSFMGDTKVHVEMFGADNKPLDSVAAKKTLDSLFNTVNFDDEKLRLEKFKAIMAKSYPDLNYGFIADQNGKKSFYPDVTVADHLQGAIKINSQINPYNNYSLVFYNLEGVVIKKMLGPIGLSVLYLLVCISALVLLINSIKKSRRLMELKDNFTHNMTHELKTPLATLYAATEALDKYNVIDDKTAAREYIQIMQADLKRLTGMAESILYNAKLSDGKIQLRREKINLKAFLADTTSKFKPRIEAMGAEVQLDKVPDDLFINADAEHIGNVFCNLVDNSLKYSSGKAVLSFEASEAGGDVRILLSDNGIGIADRYQKEIFKPYFRVSEGDQHNVKGYGLGLSYAKEIVTLHNGCIRLYSSAPGLGTTFEIIVPVNNG